MSEIPKTETVEEVAVEQISPMPSVVDVKKLTFEYAKRKVCCQITVKKVDVKTNWFRLATICNDETGILAIIFPDDEIQCILGRNAFDIEEELNDPVEMLGNHSPSRIQSIASEPIRETMELERTTETLSSPPTGKSTTKLKTRPTDENASEAIMETMELERTTETLSNPPTGKSTTKVRTRSTDEYATDSMDENVPLAKFKIFKTEKK
ncbi:hypothetical protein ACET3Z_018183 [Daucus carota]